VVDGRKGPISDFATLLKAAQTKYGTKLQWKSDETTKPRPGFAEKSGNGIACWGVRNGQLVEPDKSTLMCDDNPRARNKIYPDAFFLAKRTSSYNDLSFVFQLVDRKLMIDSVLPLRKMLEDKISERSDRRLRQSNSTPAPKL
jgi:hypothetical protein